MSKSAKPVGSISWVDLTVEHANTVHDFYRQVVGWKSSGFDMGGYKDFCMNLPKSGKTVAGICHAQGENAKLPPQWLIYITVANLKTSVKKCLRLGGKVLMKPRKMGGQGTVAVIQDPAGAFAALFQPSASRK